MTAAAGDCATISVFVAVPPADAFEVFTREIDLWWRRGAKFRLAGKRRGVLTFEPEVGGRLFETFDGPSGPRTHVFGLVTAWDPPARLEFEWHGANFAPHEKTLVEVRFAPQREGTLVTVQHRGWSTLPPDHPARHGQVGPAFSRMMGLWWAELLTSLREHAAVRTRP
jgi:uncharacterized protein YndB with AHSA1/START domain